MKYTKEEKKEAYKHLQKFRGKEIGAVIKSVSVSGMSRKIEFYADGYNRIGYYIARILDYPYDPNKGLTVKGCGMDMVFNVLSNLNYKMAFLDTGKNISELLATKECGERIYDNYFIDANNYRLL